MSDLNNDAQILAAIELRPNWLAERVLPYLKGWPSDQCCWEWDRALARGYGVVRLPKIHTRGALVYVHRVMWIHLKGAIPDGLVVDHDGDGCGNISCANPRHLAVVTRQYNNVVTGSCPSAINARKTHCPQGHPLVEGNLMPSQVARGYRSCLTCARDRDRKRAAR